jgi:hypothetical protein
MPCCTLATFTCGTAVSAYFSRDRLFDACAEVPKAFWSLRASAVLRICRPLRMSNESTGGNRCPSACHQEWQDQAMSSASGCC